MKKLFWVFISALLIRTDVYAGNKSETINVMTFNVRMATSADGVNEWKHRKDDVAGMIKYHKPDIWGGQEVTHPQLLDILEGNGEFNYIGVGRIDGKTKGEYSPIFYKKDRFRLMDHGHFWLAEEDSMFIPGIKGWDAACERIATWGIFKDRKSGKKFFMLNTHFDHVGQEARRKSAFMILEQTERLADGLPVIVTGDLNAGTGDEPVRILLEADNANPLIHSLDAAEFVYGPDWTYHAFGRLPAERRSFIDYVMINDKWNVASHVVVSDYKGNVYPSDHCPVIVQLTFR